MSYLRCKYCKRCQAPLILQGLWELNWNKLQKTFFYFFIDWHSSQNSAQKRTDSKVSLESALNGVRHHFQHLAILNCCGGQRRRCLSCCLARCIADRWCQIVGVRIGRIMTPMAGLFLVRFHGGILLRLAHAGF